MKNAAGWNGGGVTRPITSRRRVFFAASLGVALALPGCATKKDVQTLQMSMLQMQAHQDSVLRNIERQNRMMLDTIRSSMALTVDSRGQTSHSLNELYTMIDSGKALNAQILDGMNKLAARIDALEQRILNMQQAPAQPVAPTGTSGPSQNFQLGLQSMNAGSYGTARAYFGAVISANHDDPLATDAKFQIGESYVAEEDYNNAYTTFDQLAAEWPASARAPEAMYHAGQVAFDKKDYTNARKYYNKVVQLYPKSDYYANAKKQLAKIPK